MKEMFKKYNISKNFHKKYFQENSINRYGIELNKFMWFKEGKFLPPPKKIYF